MVCHQNTEFSGHRYCSSRHIMVLVCHVIDQHHEIKGTVDYNDTNPSR